MSEPPWEPVRRVVQHQPPVVDPSRVDRLLALMFLGLSVVIVALFIRLVAF